MTFSLRPVLASRVYSTSRHTTHYLKSWRAPDGGRLALPVLFVNGDYDQMNSINGNHLGGPMRAACSDLTVTSLPGAHWLPLERKAELIQALRMWLQAKALSCRRLQGD